MPYQDPDPTDPITLHSVEVEAESDEAMADMAICFVEEYARSGLDADRILRLFQSPDYTGPALALRILGEKRIRKLIEDEIAIRGPWRLKRDIVTKTSTGIALPVLDRAC